MPAARVATTSTNRSTETVTIVGHHIGSTDGTAHALKALVEGLLARGHKVVVVARRSELAPHPGMTVVRVPGLERPAAAGYPLFFLLGSILVWLRGEGVIHTAGAVIANRADVSTMHFCAHGFRERGGVDRSTRQSVVYRINGRITSALVHLAERWCYRPMRVRYPVAVSQGLANELMHHFPRLRVASIPNGVDGKAFRPDRGRRSVARAELDASPDQLIALIVASEWEGKGLRQAIEAIARCKPWWLVVLGSGDETRYRQLAQALGAEGRVLFLGKKRDVVPYYAAADALLLPSVYEAFSLVSLEAAASGLPLLMTPVNGTEELIVDGGNGWFIEREAASISRRLNELAEDPELRRAMARAARATAEQFTWPRVVEAYENVYASLALTEHQRDVPS